VLGDLAHRVLGEVQAEQLLLPAQALADGTSVAAGNGRSKPAASGAAGRTARSARDPVALGGLGGRDRVVEPEQDLAGCPNGLSAPTLASASSTLRFASRRSIRCRSRSASGSRRPRRARAMIDSMAPWPTFLTASRPNRIASPSTVNSRWLLWTSGGRTSIAHPAALGDGGRDLLLVRAEGGQDRGHVVDRVVRLHVRGLVGDQPVAGGVRLVEAVALERLEGLEHRVDDRAATPRSAAWVTNFSFCARRTADFFLRIA
jgi:hypothetical protein